MPHTSKLVCLTAVMLAGCTTAAAPQPAAPAPVAADGSDPCLEELLKSADAAPEPGAAPIAEPGGAQPE